MSLGEKNKAKAILKEYENLPNLDQFKLHLNKAKLYKLEKNKQKYISELRISDTIKKDCEVSLLLAEHYVNRWKRDSARYFIAQTTSCPIDKRQSFYTGLLYFQTRNYEEAIKNYKIAEELDSEDKTIRFISANKF